MRVREVLESPPALAAARKYPGVGGWWVLEPTFPITALIGQVNHSQLRPLPGHSHYAAFVLNSCIAHIQMKVFHFNAI